jgi:hypothetical protein
MLLSAAAVAQSDSSRWNGWEPYENHYLTLYEQCWHRFDSECGRNIVDDQFRQPSGKVRPPTEAEVKTASARLDATLHPVEPAATTVTSSESSAPAPSTTVAPTSGGGCVGMEAESGSAGYGAMSSSGYIGCYQISPDHFAAGGSCSGLGTDPAGQDQCAANICATEGAGAWTNPAGQNPCGRLGG